VQTRSDASVKPRSGARFNLDGRISGSKTATEMNQFTTYHIEHVISHSVCLGGGGLSHHISVHDALHLYTMEAVAVLNAQQFMEGLILVFNTVTY